jgi:glucokinase
VDENGKILHKDSVPTRREREYPEILKDMAVLSLKVIKDAGVDIKDVKSIGIGTPGTPNKKEGILLYANNLRFRNVPMRAEMQKYVNLPVIIDNDANCAALAESVAGAAKNADNSVTITLGTGVGGGVVIDRKVYSGFNYAAAELGHIVVVSDGEMCTCGRRGCWEAYASATALIAKTLEAAGRYPDSLVYRLVDGDLNRIDAKTAFDAARQGDQIEKSIVDQYIKYVAEGLIDIINIFCPEVLVIGGGVSKEGEYLLKPLRELVYSGVYAKDVPQTEIKAAEMGNDAGIVGAAMLGKELG